MSEHPEVPHDRFDAAPGDEELNIHEHGGGGIQGYVIGLALASGLTIASFYIAATEIVIDLKLGKGSQATVYTCDFGYGYVRINAEYHT